MARPSGHSGTWLPWALGSHTIGRATFLTSVGTPVALVVRRAAAQLTPNANKTDISENSIRFKLSLPELIATMRTIRVVLERLRARHSRASLRHGGPKSAPPPSNDSS